MGEEIVRVEDPLDPAIIASIVLEGNLSKLDDTQLVKFYREYCTRLGLDPITQPFQLLKLNGKLVLYAGKTCTQQLSKRGKISHQITDKRVTAGIYTVTVRATKPDGQFTDEDGTVNIQGLAGEPLANAMLKCVTKAKRRAVLALEGLGLLDESEVESIKGAEKVTLPPDLGQPLRPEIEEPPVVDASPAKTQAAPEFELSPPPDTTKVSSGDYQKFIAFVTEKNLDRMQVKKYMAMKWKVKSGKELTSAQMSELMEALAKGVGSGEAK
jgi:hypothetical protein